MESDNRIFNVNWFQVQGRKDMKEALIMNFVLL